MWMLMSVVTAKNNGPGRGGGGGGATSHGCLSRAWLLNSGEQGVGMVALHAGLMACPLLGLGPPLGPVLNALWLWLLLLLLVGGGK